MRVRYIAHSNLEYLENEVNAELSGGGCTLAAGLIVSAGVFVQSVVYADERAPVETQEQPAE